MDLGRNLAFHGFQSLSHLLGEFLLLGNLKLQLSLFMFEHPAELGCCRNRLALGKEIVAGISISDRDLTANNAK